MGCACLSQQRASGSSGILPSVRIFEKKSIVNGKLNFREKNKKNFILTDNCMGGKYKFFLKRYFPQEGLEEDQAYLEDIIKIYLGMGFDEESIRNFAHDLASGDKISISEMFQRVTSWQKDLLIKWIAEDTKNNKLLRRILPLHTPKDLCDGFGGHISDYTFGRQTLEQEELSHIIHCKRSVTNARKSCLELQEMHMSASDVESSDDEDADELSDKEFLTMEEIAKARSAVESSSNKQSEFKENFHVSLEYDYLRIVEFFYDKKNGKIMSKRFDELFLDIYTVYHQNSMFVEIHEKDLVIVGDIHGYMDSLLGIFKTFGHPKKTKYLFLGDYVDRGDRSLDCLILLLSLKIMYPKNMTLLRGNHEDKFCNKKYGFFDEIKLLTNDETEMQSVIEKICGIFTMLPLVARVNDNIMCLHGGIPRYKLGGKNIFEELGTYKVPTYSRDNRIVQLLWNDPQLHDGWARNMVRGEKFFSFGPDVLSEFLELHGCTHLIRGHEICQVGFCVMFDGKCTTLFSAQNYQHKENGAAALRLLPSGLGLFLML